MPPDSLTQRNLGIPDSTPPERALAAKAATSTIPIVFAIGVDPVEFGLVASLNRPGANLTGVTTLNLEVVSKRLQVLHQLVPTATALALLVNPTSPLAAANFSRDVGAAVRSLGLQLHVQHASTEREIDAAFETSIRLRAGALLIANDALFNNRIDQIVGLAAKHALPVGYGLRDFVDAGGLMSYGGSLIDAHRLVGVYTGRVLKGERPAELPVQQVTRFEFVINLTTAKALGLTVPPTLLALADDVIE
jgi:putative ABC transport system substrate-binding protein